MISPPTCNDTSLMTTGTRAGPPVTHMTSQQ